MFDATRIAGYVIISTVLMVNAISMFKIKSPVLGTMHLSFSLFFGWLIVEAALSSSGVDTRNLRVVATPAVIVVAATSVMALRRVL